VGDRDKGSEDGSQFLIFGLCEACVMTSAAADGDGVSFELRPAFAGMVSWLAVACKSVKP
jgi:hypothetical protein